MSFRLDKPLSIPEVAALAGWGERRMRRHLVALDAKVGGGLLVNIGRRSTARWSVTLEALRRASPGWFSESDERLSELEAELDELRESVAKLVGARRAA